MAAGAAGDGLLQTILPAKIGLEGPRRDVVERVDVPQYKRVLHVEPSNAVAVPPDDVPRPGIARQRQQLLAQ